MRSVVRPALAFFGLTLGLQPVHAGESGTASTGADKAAKLAGLAAFVNLECPGLRSDPARLKQTVEALGVDLASLERGEPLLAANAYIAAYRRDVTANCRKAEAMFGVDGTVIPGLVLPR